MSIQSDISTVSTESDRPASGGESVMHVTPPPGRVINHMRSESGLYIGSPSIAILPDGSYVASHDLFGPESNEHVSATTLIFRSDDRGSSWEEVARVEPAFWNNLFVHDSDGQGRGALYLMGPTHHHGLLVIRRSDDGGRTWTQPQDAATGLLCDYGQYHTAPMPMVVHGGRIWRAIEDATASTRWGWRYNPILMSAPLGANLLRRDSWNFSKVCRQSRSWLDGRFGGWLEGNAIVLPDGRMGDILRVAHPESGRAALVTLEEDGQTLSFSPTDGFIKFPGGSTKFTIRRDPLAPENEPVYWTLSNAVPPRHAKDKPDRSMIRNTLVLMRSTDLRHWQPCYVPLWHNDVFHHAFQYVDWLFDGEDLVVASRTAWDDAFGGAKHEHDANFLTFHRIEGFRKLTLADSPFNPY